MTPREWVDQVSDEAFNDDDSNGLLLMDGYDDCIVGLVTRFNDTFVLYDHAKVVAKLMQSGMSEEDANEFISVNQQGAWMGKNTVGFLHLPPTE